MGVSNGGLIDAAGMTAVAGVALRARVRSVIGSGYIPLELGKRTLEV